MLKEGLFHFGESLFEKLHDVNALRDGFQAVKRNKGSHGIDGVTVKSFESNLDKELSQLSKEIEGWSYKPKPVRRVEIPKPGKNAGVRLLGVPCIRDRVVQTAMKQLLEPIFDPTFSDNSYGFRPKRSQEQAVKAALEIVKSGKEITVDMDLSKFFDRVSHDRLIHRLSQKVEDKRILKLIGMMLRSGTMINGIIHPSEEGTVQGSPLSPLLSNIVLDELDKELEKRGLEFCRFADDTNIFVKSEKAGKRVMESISKFIETKLKLKVNWDKSKVVPSSKVKFLGMTIADKTIAISKNSIDRAMTKVRELIPRGTHLPIEKSIEEINKWYIGWANYHKMTYYPGQFFKIEAHIRRRFRARIVGQQKKRRYLAKLLIKRGPTKGSVFKYVYSNRGRWALSKSPPLHRAYSNSYFGEIGFKTFSDRDLSHWFGLKKWIKLT